MKQETASKLIEENLTAIYGYAYGKHFNKAMAEDLSSEIIVEILSSVGSLKNEKAFWGFAWKIAENTFRKFIRKQELIHKALSLETDNLVEVLDSTTYIEDNNQDEEIYRLRRELSLLSKLHRNICVAYYVNNQSCSSIAKELNISVGMVKQHLFKARNLLKEGMKMERKLGEKSYNPGTLRLDFWGDRNLYSSICDKKLPGSILLASYNCPMTPEELSVELGVAMPYLEEEIETLKAAGLLVEKGKKLETGIVIITDEYEKKFVSETKAMYHEIADEIYTRISGLLPEIRELEFNGNTYDDNRLLFEVINIALIAAYQSADSKSPIGEPHKLALGCNGWVFGYDNEYANHHFKGVTLSSCERINSTRFTAVNYSVAQEAGRLEHQNFTKMVNAMYAAMEEKSSDLDNERLPGLIKDRYIISKDGKLYANFPVFDEDSFEKLLLLLKPVCETAIDCMINISDKAEALLVKTVPKELKSQCSEIAKIHHRLDVAAFIIEDLVENKRLTIPIDPTPLGIFGIKCN